MPELDGVRGLACLFIILLHCFVGLMQPPPDSFIALVKNLSMPYLIGGVDLFFILSGLLIGSILLDSRESPNYFKNFWIRRVARILPANYLLIFGYVIATVALQAGWGPSAWRDWTLAQPLHSPLWYMTYTQSLPIALYGWGPKWMGISWSLAIEEQFYFLFPLVVYALSRKHLVAWCCAGLIISPILFALTDWKTQNDTVGYVLIPCRMTPLLFGVLIACLLRNERAFQIARRYRLFLDAVILLIACSIYNSLMIKFYLGFVQSKNEFLAALFHAPLMYFELCVFFSLVLLRLFLYEGGLLKWCLRSSLLTGIGTISYAFYMYHQAVNGTLHAIFFHDEPKVTNLSEVLVSLLVMLLAGCLAALSTFYVEKPIRDFARRFLLNQKQSAAEIVPIRPSS